MNSAHTNKVCLELLGKPVICRVAQALEDAGINSHTAVIGACASEVLKCLDGKVRNLGYAFQSRQLGPADALYCALESLPENMAPDTLILTVPGHRIISPELLHDFLDFYCRNDFPLAGLKLVDEQGATLQELSITLGRLDHIREGLQKLRQKTAGIQREAALSELAQEMNPVPEKALLAVTDKSQVIGFNNPAEFLEAAEFLRRREGLIAATEPDKRIYHRLDEWLASINSPDTNALDQALLALYNGDTSFVEQRKAAMKKLL